MVLYYFWQPKMLLWAVSHIEMSENLKFSRFSNLKKMPKEENNDEWEENCPLVRFTFTKVTAGQFLQIFNIFTTLLFQTKQGWPSPIFLASFGRSDRHILIRKQNSQTRIIHYFNFTEGGGQIVLNFPGPTWPRWSGYLTVPSLFFGTRMMTIFGR